MIACSIHSYFCWNIRCTNLNIIKLGNTVTPNPLVTLDMFSHGDWTDGLLLVTRIHEGYEKSAVARYCLHHPGYPHRREPAVQLVMSLSLVLHVLIFMSGFKIRYFA